ncbi:energy transducer TonB [Algoriphagus sp. Y33]|uniref:energy transducer TonB n=1 Tax=Algoriphagus sp. Y33 TaxID=2772483 RepID=UPI00177D2AAB|nr:energy transducer TonB [Algoriphagus sp. Y33]
MKKSAALFLLLFIFSLSFTHAQTSTHSGEDMNRFLSQTLKYPAELREAETMGAVVVSVQIDKTGFMIGDVEFLSGDPEFEDEINRTMNLLKENWNPSFLEGKAYGQEYLMSFDFRINNDSQFPPNPFITASEKAKPITPLEAVNKALEENPYSPKLLNNRAEILAQEGKKLLSDLDVNQAKFLADKMLTEVIIVGYLPTGPKSL